MRSIAAYVIVFYQAIISVILKNIGLKADCRYEVTCSEYTKRAILRHGILKGTALGLNRILSCQPYLHVHT